MGMLIVAALVILAIVGAVLGVLFSVVVGFDSTPAASNPAPAPAPILTPFPTLVASVPTQRLTLAPTSSETFFEIDAPRSSVKRKYEPVYSVVPTLTPMPTNTLTPDKATVGPQYSVERKYEPFY
jgi:hypothetical protein